MSAQMGQNCPTKAFFVAWSKLCFKYYVLWPVCHTYSTSQCLWMTWQWNSWNSHYFVFCSIVPISVSRISMLCHYIVGHCKNMRSKPILSLYWSFSFNFIIFQSMTGPSPRSVGCMSWTKVTWPLKKLTWPPCWPPQPLMTSPAPVGREVRVGSQSMLASQAMWPPQERLSTLQMLILTQGMKWNNVSEEHSKKQKCIFLI